MKYALTFLTSLLLAPLTVPPAATKPQDRAGLRWINSGPFPIPADSTLVAGADFEPDGKLPPGWDQGGGEGVVAADAPQGKAVFRMQLKHRSGPRSPVITGRPETAYFLSFWIKTPQDPWISITFTSDEREPSFTNIHTPLVQNLPNGPHRIELITTGKGEVAIDGLYVFQPPGK
jgi:hypothetical protein